MVSNRTIEQSTKTAKSERLEARITPAQKALYTRAAELSGRTYTDFVVDSLNEAAARTVREHEVMVLSAQDSAAFVAMLLKPHGPSKKLRDAAKRYNALVKR